MNEAWPRRGGKLLDHMFRICQSYGDRFLSSSLPSAQNINDLGLECHFVRDEPGSDQFRIFNNRNGKEGCLLVTARGVRSDVIGFAQQLAWMAATFRIADEQQLLYSRTAFSYVEWQDCFRLELAPLASIDIGQAHVGIHCL